MLIAIDKISQLSETEQKELVNLIEQELKWQHEELEINSILDELADEAIKEFKSNSTLEEKFLLPFHLHLKILIWFVQLCACPLW